MGQPVNVRFEVVADSSASLLMTLEGMVANVRQMQGLPAEDYEPGSRAAALAMCEDEVLMDELVHREKARGNILTFIRKPISPAAPVVVAPDVAAPAPANAETPPTSAPRRTRRAKTDAATTAKAAAEDEAGEAEAADEAEDNADLLAPAPAPAPVPEAKPALTQDQALLKALELLRTAFARGKAGAAAVKKLQKEWGVQKFADVPLHRAHELLAAGEKLLAEIPA